LLEIRGDLVDVVGVDFVLGLEFGVVALFCIAFFVIFHYVFLTVDHIFIGTARI
jgi:hypothetical protein